MVEENDAKLIAKALWFSDIKDFTPEQLGELAMIFYQNDPDVEFINLDYTPDAGENGHGINTEEEKLHTLGGS